MAPKIEISGQKYAHFGDFEGSFWIILGVKKVVFGTFSKLFWSSLGSVWALFLNPDDPLLVVFSARNVDKWPRKLSFFVKSPSTYGSKQWLRPFRRTQQDIEQRRKS